MTLSLVPASRLGLSSSSYQYTCEGGLHMVFAIRHESSTPSFTKGPGFVIRVNKDTIRLASTSALPLSPTRSSVHSLETAVQRCM
jgi:hypothetical protein